MSCVDDQSLVLPKNSGYFLLFTVFSFWISRKQAWNIWHPFITKIYKIVLQTTHRWEAPSSRQQQRCCSQPSTCLSSSGRRTMFPASEARCRSKEPWCLDQRSPFMVPRIFPPCWIKVQVTVADCLAPKWPCFTGLIGKERSVFFSADLIF